MSQSNVYPNNQKTNFASFLTSNNSSELRNDFANRVFLVVAGQAIGICTVNLLCRTFPVWAELALSFRSLWAALSLVIFVALTCFRKLARRAPTNHYLLIALTVCLGLTVFTLTVREDVSLVLKPLLHVAMATGIVAVVSSLTEVRFNSNHFLLYVFWAHLLAVLMIKWMIGGEVFTYYLMSLAVVAYLIFDLQAVMEREELSLRLDEAIFAAFKVYTDVFTWVGSALDFVFGRNQPVEQ